MPSQPAKHGALKRKRLLNAQVKSRQGKRYYSTSHKIWRSHREQQLNKHPLCKHCMAKGLITAANEVDHMSGRADRLEDYNEMNYQSLCKPCHSTKTRAEQ